MKRIKKQKSKLKGALLAILISGAVATPITLLALKFLPNYFDTKKDESSYHVIRKEINASGNEEVVFKADKETHEVSGANIIKKGDVNLKERIINNTNNTEEDALQETGSDGDYSFNVDTQTFTIYKEALDKYPGEIYIEPKIVRKEFEVICNRNIEYNDKSGNKYYLTFIKNGKDITTDQSNPVNILLNGSAASYCCINRDDFARPYINIVDNNYFGKIEITCTRTYHKDVKVDFEIGSFSKLTFTEMPISNKDNNEGPNPVYISQKEGVTSEEYEKGIAVPNRIYMEKDKEWHTVKGISDYGFKECKAKVLNLMFHDHNKDQNRNQPNEIGYIGKEAFAKCENLTSINLEKVSCEYLEEPSSDELGIFEGCTKLSSSRSQLKLPLSITSIPSRAFKDCTENFTDIDFITENDKITSIGTDAFINCENLGKEKTITFPSNLKSIGEKAFYNCTFKKGLEFKNKLESIGPYAFATPDDKTGGLTSVKFFGGADERTLFTCGECAFNNHHIKDIYFDSDVVIKSQSFKVTTPTDYRDGNKSRLFDACSYIQISSNITSKLSGDDFKSSFINQHFETSTKTYNEYKTYLPRLTEFLKFIKISGNDYNVELRDDAIERFRVTEIVIPSTYKHADGTEMNIKGFTENAFDVSKHPNYPKIQKIDISNNTFITTIPKYCFNGQNSLETVKFNNSKTYVFGKYSFSGCSKISDKAGVIAKANTISEYAFNGFGNVGNSIDLKNCISLSTNGLFGVETTTINNLGNSTYKVISAGQFNGCSFSNVNFSLPQSTESKICSGAFANHQIINSNVTSGNYKYWTRSDNIYQPKYDFEFTSASQLSESYDYTWRARCTYLNVLSTNLQSAFNNIRYGYYGYGDNYEITANVGGGTNHFTGMTLTTSGGIKYWTKNIQNNNGETTVKFGFEFTKRGANINLTFTANDNPTLKTNYTIGVAVEKYPKFKITNDVTQPNSSKYKAFNDSNYSYELNFRTVNRTEVYISMFDRGSKDDIIWEFSRKKYYTTEVNTSCINVYFRNKYPVADNRVKFKFTNWDSSLAEYDFAFFIAPGLSREVTKLLPNNDETNFVKVNLQKTNLGDSRMKIISLAIEKEEDAWDRLLCRAEYYG